MKKSELLGSKEYWIAQIQLDLFEHVETYLSENEISRAKFAEDLGVSKGYVSQILNGDFDHRISKYVEICLASGVAPQVSLVPIADVLEDNYLRDDDFFDVSHGIERQTPIVATWIASMDSAGDRTEVQYKGGRYQNTPAIYSIQNRADSFWNWKDSTI